MIRPACTLFGMLALLLQGSSGGHMLLVEHTRCAEHGDLVHGDEAHRHAAAEPGETHELALEAYPTEGSSEAHGHCALCADRRDAPAVVSEATLIASVPRALEPALARVATPGSSTQRFRLAPKNSPPA